MFKVYKKYIVTDFATISLKITFVFIVMGFIMGILEEMSFFSEIETSFYFPIFLVLLNIPSLIYEIFPFIFLLSSQFYFLKILENGELNTLKKSGLSNLKIISIISSLSFIAGLIIIIIFYNFSSSLKFIYLDIKKNYTKDNKYLATVTENGLWIKDEIDSKIYFINSKKFSEDLLQDVDIIELDKNFNFIKNIKSEKVDIKTKVWELSGNKILDNNNDIKLKDNLTLNSNFNYKEINNLFSNLSSLNMWRLIELMKNYFAINYSTTEIEHHLHKLAAYPFFITIITVLSSIIMLNINYRRPKLFLIVMGILLSVCIYYINFFFGTLGKNEKLPLLVSVWTPIIILTIFSLIGLIRINEK